MSHACEILVFDEKLPKSRIQAGCDAWGDRHADLKERGGPGDGLGFPVRFTDKVFNTEEEACSYLEHTFGDYKQIAVRFKRPLGKTPEPTQKLILARKRVQELYAKVQLYRQPHYLGVKSKTIGCKNCGSTLATAFCGKTFTNNCPVCRADLRPPSTLKAMQTVQENYKKAKKELDILEQRYAESRTKAKYKMFWAVACEVHS